MIFEWSKSAVIDGDANQVGAALERIATDHGALEPVAIVQAAQDESSVLHPYFLWDDAEAGNLYRQEQAKYLVSAIQIVCDEGEEPPPSLVSIRVIEKGERAERRTRPTQIVRINPVHELIDKIRTQLWEAEQGMIELQRLADDPKAKPRMVEITREVMRARSMLQMLPVR